MYLCLCLSDGVFIQCTVLHQIVSLCSSLVRSVTYQWMIGILIHHYHNLQSNCSGHTWFCFILTPRESCVLVNVCVVCSLTKFRCFGLDACLNVVHLFSFVSSNAMKIIKSQHKQQAVQNTLLLYVYAIKWYIIIALSVQALYDLRACSCIE